MRETSCDQHPHYTVGCAECKVRNKQYRDRNNQRIRDQQNARYQRDHDHVRAVANENRRRNAEHYNAEHRRWIAEHPERWNDLQRLSYYRHHESRKQRLREGYQKYRAQRRLSAKLRYQQVRIQVLKLLGGECVVCRITDLRILNVNHLKGKGTKDLRSNDPLTFYKKIISGERDGRDFDARCYNHNLLFEYDVGRRIWLTTRPSPSENPNLYRRWLYQQKRMRLINYLGGRCVQCAETDIRILTVNHLGGGGARAFRSATSENQYYTDILDGRLSKELFDVRCMNHNILYEYQVGRCVWLIS